MNVISASDLVQTSLDKVNPQAGSSSIGVKSQEEQNPIQKADGVAHSSLKNQPTLPQHSAPQQGLLGRAAHKVVDRFFDKNSSPELIIEQRRKELNLMLGSPVITDLIQSTIAPQLSDLVQKQIPELAAQTKFGWFARWGAKAAVYTLKGDIPNWVEATCLNLICNILKPPANNENQQPGIEDVSHDSVVVLRQALDKICSILKVDIEEIKNKFNAIDADINENKSQLRRLAPDGKNDKDLPIQRKNLEKVIERLNNQKKEIVQEVVKEFLKFACPNGEKDLACPLADKIYPVVVQKLPQLILEVIKKMRTGVSQIQDNVLETEKKYQEKGASDVLKLLGVVGTHFSEVLINGLVSKGKETLGKESTSDSLKIAAEIAQQLSGDQAKDVKGLLGQLGGYSEKLMHHIFANLCRSFEAADAIKRTKGIVVNEDRHVLTRIIENFMESLLGFSKEKEMALAEAYSKFLDRKKEIEKKYKTEPNNPAKKLALEEAFQPVKNIFAPHADQWMKIMGIDSVGLQSILPQGAGLVANQVKLAMISQMANIYRDTFAPSNKDNPGFEKLANFTESEGIVKKIVAGFLPSLKPKLIEKMKGSSGDYSQMLVNQIKKLLPLDQPIGDALFVRPIQELTDSPVFGDVMTVAGDYVGDALVSLLGNLALSNSDNVTGQPIHLEVSGILHLLSIFEKQDLVNAIAVWQKMPSGNNEEIEAKKIAKNELLKTFIPCIKEILSQGGWDNPENIRAPEALKKQIRELVETTALPELLLMLGSEAADMKNHEFLSPEDQENFKKLPGAVRLQRVGESLCKKVQPSLLSGLQNQAYLVGGKVNDNVCRKASDEAALSASEETVLSSGLKNVFPSLLNPEGALGSFINNLIQSLIQGGLAKLALSGPRDEDALTNIIMQLRMLIAEHGHALENKIEEYLKKEQAIRQKDIGLETLRNKLIEEVATIGQEAAEWTLTEQVVSLNGIVGQIPSAAIGENLRKLKNDIKSDVDIYSLRLQANILERKKTLTEKTADQIGRNSEEGEAQLIQLIGSYREEITKALKNQIAELNENESLLGLEDRLAVKRKMAMETYEQSGLDCVYKSYCLEIGACEAKISGKREKAEMRDLRERYEGMKNEFKGFMGGLLKKMGLESAKNLPVPSFMQDNLWTMLNNDVLPELALKVYIESAKSSGNRQENMNTLTARGLRDAPKAFANAALKYLDNMIVVKGNWLADMLAKSGFGVEGEDKKHPVGRNDMGTIGKNVPRSHEFVMPLLGKELEGQFIDLLSGILNSLDTQKASDPKALFNWTMDFVELLSGNLEAIQKITEENGQRHMFAVDGVDPLAMVKGFEKANLLDPAMIGSADQQFLGEVNEKIVKQHEKLKPLKSKVATLKAEQKKLEDLERAQQKAGFKIDVGFSSSHDLTQALVTTEKELKSAESELEQETRSVEKSSG